MKKQFAFLVLILMCSTAAVARVRHYNVRQLYSGEAKARAEVVWVWLDYDVRIAGIDGEPVAQTAKPVSEMSRSELNCLNGNHYTIMELLPGKHEISVYYSDPALGVHSSHQLPLSIDAKAGENYQVTANFKAKWVKNGQWNPAIMAFTPDMTKVEIVAECRQ